MQNVNEDKKLKSAIKKFGKARAVPESSRFLDRRPFGKLFDWRAGV